jgi:NAD(P)-dependent dehydrogenase (short-subunit alcohol dehydrogenase family)
MKSPLVVLGATGNVGSGVVAAAVAEGWPVIAVARDAGALKQLQAGHPGADLTVVPASVGTDEDGARLAKTLRKLGRPLAGVVACVCGPAERGRLLDKPATFLRRTFDEDVLPHLAAARNLLPLLAEANRGGGYLLIGGRGEHPWAGYGQRSIGAAALHMLARVLHDEARALPVRVQLLAIDSPLITEANRCHACDQWPSAQAVGRRALSLINKPRGPADAVVHFSAINGESDVDSTLAGSTPTYASEPAHATDVAVPTEDDTGLLPSRCLQDARNLLTNLLSPHRNQEPSSS